MSSGTWSGGMATVEKWNELGPEAKSTQVTYLVLISW